MQTTSVKQATEGRAPQSGGRLTRFGLIAVARNIAAALCTCNRAPLTRSAFNSRARGRKRRAQTWSESFPVARRVGCPAQSTKTLVITKSGSPGGYVIYEPADQEGSSIDRGQPIRPLHRGQSVSYPSARLTLKGARVHAILLGEGAHDVVIEGCDISGWGRMLRMAGARTMTPPSIPRIRGSSGLSSTQPDSSSAQQLQ